MADEKARLFRLAWDLIGTQCGSLQTPYERFFNGDVVQLRMRRYAQYDHSRAEESVRRFMREVMVTRIEDFAKLIPESFLNRPGSVFHSGRLAFEYPSELYILVLQPQI